MKRTSKMSWILFAVLLSNTCFALTIYVDVDAAGNNDGSSWSDAYNYLQDALANAGSNPAVDEIRVAEGIYTPDSNSVEPDGSGDRDATFQIINGVALKGGYAGYGEPNPNERNVGVYKTILSGDLEGNDVGVNDPCDLENETTRAENSYHVVTSSNTDLNTILDGFTITAGKANRPGGEGYGGAMGGGMFNESANLTVTNCAFTGNSAHYMGGGMYNGGFGAEPVITNCTFTANWARVWGGGMENEHGSPTITNCTFIGNDPSGMENDHCSQGGVVGCTFTGNVGLGMQNWGGNVTVVDCIFSQNGGGGMFNEQASAQVTNCTFINNSGYYGGMDNYDSSTTVTNCTFSGNSTYSNGGGISTMGSHNYLRVTNCTFSGNSASKGGGIYNMGCEATLTNCILWDNTASDGNEIALYDSWTMDITYCDVRGGAADVYVESGSTLNWGAGNTDDDPMLADLGYWDPNDTMTDPNDDFWVDGDYHLKSQAGRWDSNIESWIKDDGTSPCIDAGNPNSSIGKEPFPNGGRVNVGAYGGTVEASKSYCGDRYSEEAVAADINGDCNINWFDFAIMASYWMAELTPDPCVPDDMAYIPDGEFLMGDHFAEGDSDELPLHAVLLDSFFMSRYETTNQQYCDYLNSALGSGSIYLSSNVVYGTGNNQVYCDTSASHFRSQIDYNDVSETFSVRTKGEPPRDMSDDPMLMVSWWGAAAYCNWRSGQEGKELCYNLSTWNCDFSKKGYRLATEAEWEYAARGGEHDPYYRYPWGDSIDGSKANYWGSGDSYETGPYPWTTPVGYYSANAYGLYDMAGNVWEWCNDWYSNTYYSSSPPNNPTGPTSGNVRVLRGGGWPNIVYACRVAYRGTHGPGTRYDGNGFRVVLDLN